MIKNAFNTDSYNMLASIDDYLKNQIDVICKRLKKSVDSYDVLKWLTNFRPEEHADALTVLSKVEYFTENEFIDLFNERLKTLISKISNDDEIIIHPIAELGKSGTMMLYYIKKTPTYRDNEGRIQLYAKYRDFKIEKKKKSIKSKTTLVLLDDFLGSGQSFIKYYKTYIHPQDVLSPFKTRFIVSLFYLTQARTSIQKTFKNSIILIGEERKPSFLSDGSIFGYREKMIPLRKFCYDHGKNLFSIRDPKTKKETKYPLGYNNSQGLIVFPYGPPNNTLPIIWSSVDNWKPLYPRTSETKMTAAREYRKKLAFDMSIIRYDDIAKMFYNGKKDIGWKKFTFITKTDFALFTIIQMVRQRRAIPVICQTLGISSADYEKYIQDGIENNIFNKEGLLTSYGEEVYLTVSKKIHEFKTEYIKKELTFHINNINYIPKVFNGRP